MVQKLKEGWSLEVSLGNVLTIVTIGVHLGLMMWTQGAQQQLAASRMDQVRSQVDQVQGQLKTLNDAQIKTAIDVAVLQNTVNRIEHQQIHLTP